MGEFGKREGVHGYRGMDDFSSLWKGGDSGESGWVVNEIGERE